MKAISAAAFLTLLLSSEFSQAATVHRCSADAVAQAKKLLVFYLHLDDGAAQWSVDDRARQIGTVSAIRGKRRYDVLEVWGNVYKARYRMRLIYALVGGQCTLMGEEILEDAVL